MSRNYNFLYYANHSDDIKSISKGSEYSAGHDMYADENKWIFPFTVTKVKLNISVELQNNTFGLVTSRSGLSSAGVVCIPGVIDSDYRGQVCALMTRIGFLPKRIKKGDRIAQMIVLEHHANVHHKISLNELSSTERGANGFGSSGIE